MENLVRIFIVTSLISASTTTQQVFYVIPDRLVNVSCSSQPCATLGQYLLDNNGSLPVVSNVEYHFLPGEHHVPRDMKLQYLHNFAMIGSDSSTSISTEIISSLQSYVKIFNSVNVSIINVIFTKQAYDIRMSIEIHNNRNFDLFNLAFINCSNCIITKVELWEYGFYGENLCGRSYLNDILIELTDIPLCCFYGISLLYKTFHNLVEHPGECMLVMNRISVTSNDMYGFNLRYSTGVTMQFLDFKTVLTIVISNSDFYSMKWPILYIDSGRCANKTVIKIYNCTIRENGYSQEPDIQPTLMEARLAYFNVTLMVINCKFIDNFDWMLLSLLIDDEYSCRDSVKTSCVFSSKFVITNCTFIDNDWRLLKLYGSAHEPLTCTNIYISGPLYIYGVYIDNFFQRLYASKN